MVKLYELAAQYQALRELEDSGEIDAQALSDTLEGLSGEIEEKADNVACVIKELLADAEAIKQEADKLIDRAKVKKRYADGLTQYLTRQMQAVGKSKVETHRNVISLRKTPVSVKIADEGAFVQWASLAHEEFLRQKAPEIDKTAVKDALKAGLPVPGAQLQSGVKLQIK